MATAKQVINSIRPKRIPQSYSTPKGEIGYDNVRDDLEKVKKLREGSVEKVPVFNNDIVNKLALDTAIAGVPADVDWTISQAPAVIHADNYTDTDTTYTSSDFDHNSLTNAHNLTTDINHDALTNFAANEHFTEASIDHTAITNIGTNTHAQIDTAITASTNHIADNTQAHSDYLLNSGTDIAVGPITITADNSTADQAYVPMVLYNTDAVPPAASGFPIGTLYIQYTA